MRVLILSVLVVLFAVSGKSEDIDADKRKFVELCSVENGMSKDEFSEYRESKRAGNQVTATASIKCALKCLYEKIGFFDAAGRFQADTFRNQYSYIDKDLLRNVISSCELRSESDPCEKAYKFYICTSQQKVAA